MTPEEKTLWYWVRERENIRIRKEDGRAQKLWTADRILQTYRFCNVRREDDRVTRWITKNVKERFCDNENLWFMLCIARMINWPPTLRKLIDTTYAWPIDQWDAMTFSHTIDHIEGKTFTGAYIIPAGPSGGSKARFLADKVLGSLWKDKAKFSYCFSTSPSMREVHALLMEYSGWGQFLAYQAVVDMRFTHLLNSAGDRHDWAAAGPGTIRGLNRIHQRPLDYRLSQKQALTEMVELDNHNPTAIQFDFSDIPNILCESDKYLRVKNKEGKPRSIYKSETAF